MSLAYQMVDCPHCGGKFVDRGLKRHIRHAHPQEAMSTPTQPEDSERKVFEAWRRRETKIKNKDDAVARHGVDHDAHYVNQHTKMMWYAWQKRAALAAPQQAGGDATLEAIRQIIVEEGSGFLEVRDAYGSIQGLLAAAPAAAAVDAYKEPEAVATLISEGWVWDGDQWVLPKLAAAVEPSDDAKAAELPPFPPLSHFLENSTHDMQRDAIRAYGLQCYRLAMADRDRLAAEVESLKEEFNEVLADWNALRSAVGSPTNGGALGHAAALRKDAQRYQWLSDEAATWANNVGVFPFTDEDIDAAMAEGKED